MQQHIYYTKYALQFADMQISELVTVSYIKTPPLPSALGKGGVCILRTPHKHAYQLSCFTISRAKLLATRLLTSHLSGFHFCISRKTSSTIYPSLNVYSNVDGS